MNILQRLTLLVAGCSSWSPQCWAQEVTTLTDAHNAARVEVGLDSAWTTRLSYARRVSAVPDHDLLVSLGVAFAVAEFDVFDSMIDLPVRTTIIGSASWKLDVSLGTFLRNTDNALFSAHAVGASIHVLPGYWGSGWGLGLNVGYEQSFTTYLKHSDKYKELVYAQARDGFYRNLAATWNLGAQGGALLGPVELVLRAGLLTTQQFAWLTIPAYAVFGAAYRF